MNNSQTSLQQLYNRIWQQARQALLNGGPHIDPHLKNLRRDCRLGMTVIARPSRTIIREVLDLQNRLRELEPLQHYYQADELHVTILTLFNVMEDYDQYMANMPLYEEILPSAFANMPPFQIVFQGISASPEAVMIQGFPLDAQLQTQRETLREVLHAHDLGDTLDVRYRISTAHSTIMRFSRPLRDASALLGLLGGLRKEPFGEFTCNSVQWVKNDWYMSSDKVELLAEYELLQPTGGINA